jgi:RNA polymerase sigma-70 factor, ECF subfamily
MNKSEILKQAWKIFKTEKITFSDALKKSWTMYKAPKSNPDSEFNMLYKAYHDDVYNFIRKFYPKDNDIIENICNDTFINVRNNLEKFDCTKVQIKTWIIGIAKNICIDYYRANKRRKNSISDIDINKVKYDKSYVAQDNVQIEEIKSTVNNAMDRLNENQKKICELIFLEGMKYQEVADMLCISLNSVRVNVNRSRKILQSDKNLKNCHMAMYN